MAFGLKKFSFRLHHEIYMSNVRKVTVQKWKTQTKL